MRKVSGQFSHPSMLMDTPGWELVMMDGNSAEKKCNEISLSMVPRLSSNVGVEGHAG